MNADLLSPNRGLSKFRCMNHACGHRYEAAIGPTSCPRCGSIYVEWLNYRQQFPNGPTRDYVAWKPPADV